MKDFVIKCLAIGTIFMGYSQEIVQEEKITSSYYGEKIDDQATEPVYKMLEAYEQMNESDTLQTKFTARVKEVCKAKGCWMKLTMGDNKEVMVRFKDYGFFMPMDIEGKEVTVSGAAFVESMSVANQRHYAKDAGASEAEMAEITKAKKTYGFEANGVMLKN